jgi:hypothetical protein
MAYGVNVNECFAHTMEVAATPDTVNTGVTHLWGFLVETDKTNDATVVLKDGETEIITYNVVGTEDSAHVTFPMPIRFSTSLVVELTGTGSRVVVLWGP